MFTTQFLPYSQLSYISLKRIFNAGLIYIYLSINKLNNNNTFNNHPLSELSTRIIINLLIYIT